MISGDTPQGLWVNVWRGARTGAWIGLVRDGTKAVATIIGETEAEVCGKAEARIAELRKSADQPQPAS